MRIIRSVNPRHRGLPWAVLDGEGSSAVAVAQFSSEAAARLFLAADQLADVVGDLLCAVELAAFRNGGVEIRSDSPWERRQAEALRPARPDHPMV